MKFVATVEKVAEEIGMAPFCSTLLNTVTLLHYAHLQTRSFAQHEALKFYSELEDQADGFIEMYQGLYGVIDDYPQVTVINKNDPVQLLKELYLLIEAAHTAKWMPSDRCLHNKLDEINGAVAQTLYKVINLK